MYNSDICMQFRKATNGDADRIWEIIQQAQVQMRRLNSKQWQNGYPAPANIASDIEQGYGYVLSCEGRVIAYGAVIFDGEPAYEKLDGKWLSDAPYVMVHRLAVADEAKQRGIAIEFMHRVEELSRSKGIKSFRVDTNFDNYYMLKVLAKLGFVYCGEVVYRDPRQAFEKLL